MSLPVSQYEALLAEVRGLRKRAQHVQQLVNPFINNNTTISTTTSVVVAAAATTHPSLNTTRNSVVSVSIFVN